MNCAKCNQPMKEYFNFSSTGWDCVNPNCGKEKSPTLGFDVEIKTLKEYMLGIQNELNHLAFDRGIVRRPDETDEQLTARIDIYRGEND